MGKLCLPPGPPAGLMVSTNFPQGGSVGFLMDTERRTLRGIAAHSHVKLATGPLELANRCNSQPMLHHLTTFYIIRQTAQQTTHSHRSTPDHVKLPVTLPSPQATRLRFDWLLGEGGREGRGGARINTKAETPNLFSLLFICLFFAHSSHRTRRRCRSPKRVLVVRKADKCNEIQNLRAARGAEVRQFVTISDRMSWPLQLKQ